MITEHRQIIIAVVPSNARASTERVRKALALSERPRTVTAQESELYLSQQIGGNSPLNADSATVLFDPKVLVGDWILTGGGDCKTLTKISLSELKRVVNYREVRVRK